MSFSNPSQTDWRPRAEPIRRPPIRVLAKPKPANAGAEAWPLAGLASRVLYNDVLFLSVVAVSSWALALGGLGFANQDWPFLQQLGNAPQRSLFLLVAAIDGPQTHAQPVHLWYVASLYHLLGPRPFGYHLVSGALLLATVLLGHLLLREIGLPRLVTVMLPASLAFLSGDSADRLSAFGFSAAPALAVLSLYADLRALRQGLRRFWLWKPIAVLTLVVGGLTSAAVIPLLVLGQPLAWRAARSLSRERGGRQLGRARWGLVAASAVGSMLVLGALCWWIVWGSGGGSLRQSYPEGSGQASARLVTVNIGAQVLLLLSQVSWVLRHTFDYPFLLVAGALGGLLFGAHMWHVSAPGSSTMPKRATWLILTLLGLVVFCAGQVVAFTTTAVGSHAAGLGEAGAAITVLAFIGLVSSLVPSDLLRRELCSVLTTLVCVSGFMLTSVMPMSAEGAYTRQDAVAQHLRERLSKPPRDSTVLIEQACPGNGRAPTFDTPQQLAGMLAVTYHDPSLKGVMVTPRVVIEEAGLRMIGHPDRRAFYPYGERLFIYNESQQEAYQLTTAEQAHRYFMTYQSRTQGCTQVANGNATRSYKGGAIG
jgi:hypothetical protein